MAQGEAYGAAAIPAANCLERVDDVFADMTMPHQPGGRAPGHRPWRAPLQQVLWPRGSGNAAADHGG